MVFGYHGADVLVRHTAQLDVHTFTASSDLPHGIPRAAGPEMDRRLAANLVTDPSQGVEGVNLSDSRSFMPMASCSGVSR